METILLTKHLLKLLYTEIFKDLQRKEKEINFYIFQLS